MQQVLTTRALNRALLARQGLIEPWTCGPLHAVRSLIGMQAQSPTAPYVGLWSRLADFEPEQLSTLLLERDVVRIALMRSTLQLVSAPDCLALRPVLQADLLRALPAALRNRDDLDQIAALARALVEERPRTFAELGGRLAERFEATADDLNRIARSLLALVQVTPRGVWGQRMAATHTTAEAWLSCVLAASTEPDELILRYLAAFGPATAADLAAWSSLSGARARLERLRPQLRVYANERGQQLFDVPDGLLPDPATPVPVRIVAEFDNLLLGHADRSRIFDDQHRGRFMSVNGLVSSTFLIDGFVAGTVKLDQSASRLTVTLRPFGTLTATQRRALSEQAERLARFVSPAAEPQVLLRAEW